MNDKKSFKITDKRTFDDHGVVKDPEALKEEEPESQTTAHEDKKETKTDPKHSKKHERRFDPVRVDFLTFVTSMHTSGAMHLGLIPNPMTGGSEADIELAKQDIDILEMLDEKTKGNLDNREAKMLENALYELRIKYVELSKNRN